MPGAAILSALAFAVVGVALLLSLSGLATERARTREPRNVGDDGKTNPAIDHESRTVVSAVEPVTEPAPKPPPAGRSGVEERYPSTLEVESGVPVVVGSDTKVPIILSSNRYRAAGVVSCVP